MITEDNELDELIFDYLEGNLDTNEKEAFEILLSENDTLQQLVKQWKNTIITESFPATRELEQRIIKPDKNVVRIFSSRLFIVGMLLLFIFSLTETKEELPNHAHLQKEIILPEVNDSEELLCEPFPASFTREAIQNTNRKKITTQKKISSYQELSLRKEPETLLTLSTPSTTPLTETLSPTPAITMVDDVSIKIWQEKNKFTRSTQRKINKKRRKDYEEKLALPFLKGKVPYVVPLNTKNF
jgi:hypothetical protein